MQVRLPRPVATGDLDPDNTVPGPDRDRDHPPGTRPAVPDAVAEDLTSQQDGHVSARVPGAEYRSKQDREQPGLCASVLDLVEGMPFSFRLS
jgi:hypothetical protein